MYARGFGTGPKWLPATIEETTGPVSYLVRLEDQRLVRHHQDHLRKRKTDHNPEAKEGDKPEAPNEESNGNNIDMFADFTTPERPDSNISQSQGALGTSQLSGSQNTDHSGSLAQVCAPTKTNFVDVLTIILIPKKTCLTVNFWDFCMYVFCYPFC